MIVGGCNGGLEWEVDIVGRCFLLDNKDSSF